LDNKVFEPTLSSSAPNQLWHRVVR